MRNLVDLKESYDGDLISEGGDLMDTGGDESVCAYQLIRTILNTPIGDSDLFMHMGFNPNQYEGLPNTERTARNIALAIKSAITENSVFYPFEVSVDPYPVGKHAIAFRIKLATVSGTLQEYTTVYDTKDNFIRSMVFHDEGSQDDTIVRVPLPPLKPTRG